MNASSADLRKALLIIVTFNSYEAITDVVGSIRFFLGDHAGNHVIVIENSSDRRVYDFLGSNLSSDRIFVEVASHNEGFSHGVNLGYRLAQDLWGKFDLVVLLNPDVISAGGVVCELVTRAAAPSDASIGVWGVVLKDERGNIDRGCARRVWNRRRFFSHLVGQPDLVRWLHTAPRSLTEQEIESNQSELAMVSGALMCIRAGVLERGLDTLLPMYLEDQEICMRCPSRGYGIRLYPDLEAVHVGGASRKSVTNHEHALRIMELVESPVQCMSTLQGYGLTWLRLTVLVGGISRLVAAPLVAVVRTLFHNAEFRSEIVWISEQRRLAIWFVRWAINGTFHTREVSLTEYYQEYATISKRRPRR